MCHKWELNNKWFKVVAAWIRSLERCSQHSHSTHLTPFTAPACKISGLKIALIHACEQYIRCSYNKSTFNAVHFDKVLSRAHAKEGKSFNDFKFGTYVLALLCAITHFQSDGTSSMAVKGLISWTDGMLSKCWGNNSITLEVQHQCELRKH